MKLQLEAVTRNKKTGYVSVRGMPLRSVGTEELQQQRARAAQRLWNTLREQGHTPDTYEVLYLHVVDGDERLPSSQRKLLSALVNVKAGGASC